jgi:hypothetical protein
MCIPRFLQDELRERERDGPEIRIAELAEALADPGREEPSGELVEPAASRSPG